MRSTFEYGTTRVRDLRVRAEVNELSGKSRVTGLEVEGQPVDPTKRFWTSFSLRFGISAKIFKYFDHYEVFQRIAQRVRDDAVRYCVETDAKGRRKLLAVSGPNRPVARPAEVLDVAERYGGEDIAYNEGVITSAHVPRSGEAPVQIGADLFEHRFRLETPIDGFGIPRIYLSLLRLVCANGMVGYAPAFRTEIRVGKEVTYSLERALESYDNGEGYAALRQRFQSAQSSWASLNECQKFYRVLATLQNSERFGPNVLNDFHRVTGNLNELYGLANLDALPLKRQRVLPARCLVYDLLNFASELATHHASPLGSRVLQAHIGTLISDEYDMEGTAETMKDFSDFFVQKSHGGPLASSN